MQIQCPPPARRASAFASILVLLLLTLVHAPVLAFSPERFVNDARSQIGKTLYYDPSYVRIPYPMGDIPLDRGVCTDVIIRALRKQGIDLQQRVHEDMRQNFHLYPNLPRWERDEPDTNIDHRRVLNLQRYFERSAYAVKDGKFLPGDIVTWNMYQETAHIGIVSNKKTRFKRRPLIIHNMGYGTQEEDALYRFTISGHYRIREKPGAR